MDRVELLRKLSGVKKAKEPEYVDVRVRVLKQDAETLNQVAVGSGASTQAILGGMISTWARRARAALRTVEPAASPEYKEG